MKTQTQQSFELIVKDSIHAILKPLGFKKKGLNFYRDLSEIGHFIQIQKSQSSTNSKIKFTINISIFEPKFYLACHGKELPTYPTEPVCLVRKRISYFLGENDHWFFINENTDVEKLTFSLQQYVLNDILPFFEKYRCLDNLKTGLLNQDLKIHPYEQMIFFAEHKDVSTAKYHYENLLKTANEYFVDTLNKTAKHYNLID